MQVTNEDDRTLPSHDALGEMDFGIKSISLTARFVDGLQLAPTDTGSDCLSEVAVVELLQHAIDSLQDHELPHGERERIEKLIREILGGDDVELEVEVTLELRDGRQTR